MNKGEKNNAWADDSPSAITMDTNLNTSIVACTKPTVNPQNTTIFRNSQDARLQEALQWQRRGWAILPLKGKDPYFELLPRDAKGKPRTGILRDNPASEADIRAWLEYDPDLNFGLFVKKGYAIADFDCEPPKDWHMPLTPRCITNRGEHVYFKTLRPVKSQKIEDSEGNEIGDLKAPGSYVALAGSIHPLTGHVYHWAELFAPSDLGWEFADIPHTWPLESTYKTERKEGEGYIVFNTILPSSAEGYSGDSLRQWFTRADVLLVCASYLGISTDGGKPLSSENLTARFNCVLPGHKEQHPSASFCRDPQNGAFMYHDWHAGSEGREVPEKVAKCSDGQYHNVKQEFFTLAEVYASQHYNEVKSLNGPEQAVWGLRLLVDAGIIEPAKVELEPLPDGIKPAVKKVYEGFKLLLGCKWLHSPNEPTAFTWKFASAWCNLSMQHLGKAMKELLSMGYIKEAGKMKSGRGRAMKLWLPGDKALIKKRANRKEPSAGRVSKPPVRSRGLVPVAEPNGTYVADVEPPPLTELDIRRILHRGDCPSGMDRAEYEDRCIRLGVQPSGMSDSDFYMRRMDLIRMQSAYLSAAERGGR